jgi:hypothetical protein
MFNNYVMTEGDQLKHFIDNQAIRKIKIASDLGMSKQNLYGLFKSKELSADTKRRFENYFGKAIFTKKSSTSSAFNHIEASQFQDTGDDMQYGSFKSRPITEAEMIREKDERIKELKEQLSWIKSVIDANLKMADSDRELMMAALKNLTLLSAEIYAAGDKKKYESKMAEYRKALGADGSTKT